MTPAVPDPTVEALSERERDTLIGIAEMNEDWAPRLIGYVESILAARAAAPDALRARIEALIERCRGNYADDAGGGEPLRNYVLIEELRAQLED